MSSYSVVLPGCLQGARNHPLLVFPVPFLNTGTLPEIWMTKIFAPGSPLPPNIMIGGCCLSTATTDAGHSSTSFSSVSGVEQLAAATSSILSILSSWTVLFEKSYLWRAVKYHASWGVSIPGGKVVEDNQIFSCAASKSEEIPSSNSWTNSFLGEDIYLPNNVSSSCLCFGSRPLLREDGCCAARAKDASLTHASFFDPALL